MQSVISSNAKVRVHANVRTAADNQTTVKQSQLVCYSEKCPRAMRHVNFLGARSLTVCANLRRFSAKSQPQNA